VIEIFQRRGSKEKIGCPNFAFGGSDSEPFRMRPRGVCVHRIWAKAPPDKENNRMQTIPGKGWNTILRVYGPLEPWFNKAWRPVRSGGP